MLDNSLFQSEIVEISDGIFEVANLQVGSYDGHAIKYDNITISDLYNRIMWGNTPKDYARFCRHAINEHRLGVLADIGCGTLSFTAEAYAKSRHLNLFLCDLSYDMLKIGKERLELGITRKIDDITFLRSDALNMPFKSQCIQTLFCFGFMHILENPAALISELYRILHADGKLYLTSLCTDRKLSARYLNYLFKKGIVAKPMNSNEIIKIIEANGFRCISSNIIGGMIYIEAIK